MPILTLNASDLDTGWAFFKVLATMVHPDNPRYREELLAIVWAHALPRVIETIKDPGIKETREIATQTFFLLPIRDPITAIQVLRQAPSEDTVYARLKKAFYQGYVAGRLLQLMISIQMTGYAPSLEKAVFLMERILFEARTQTGKKVPHSRKEIYKAWGAFKSVAHFWSAFYISYPQDQVEALSHPYGQEHHAHR